MSIHVCKCIHNGREEWHLRYPGMSEAAAQELADKINGGIDNLKNAVFVERLSCARLCDEEAELANMQAREGGRAMDDGRAIGAKACAGSIRARSNAAAQPTAQK